MTYPQYFLLLLGQAVETSQMYFQRIFVSAARFYNSAGGQQARESLLTLDIIF